MKVRWLTVAAILGATCALIVSGVVSAGPSDPGALFAVLKGKKEVSATGDKGVGDPDGRGSFSAVLDGDELCYGITVKNIAAPVAAHIHKGSPRVAGPIVVPLTHPTTGDPGASSGCTVLDPALAQAIRRNPAKYYVNVHTGDFPGGAVRGQLFKSAGK
jgi:hypothetical protein